MAAETKERGNSKKGICTKGVAVCASDGKEACESSPEGGENREDVAQSGMLVLS